MLIAIVLFVVFCVVFAACSKGFPFY